MMGGTGSVVVSDNGKRCSDLAVNGIPKLYTLYHSSADSEGLLALSFSPGIQAYDSPLADAGLAIRLVVEPPTGDDGHELRLRLEAKGPVEVDGVVGLQTDVLAGYQRHQVADQGRSPPRAVGIRIGSTHVQEVGVADAIGEEPGHADDPVAVAGHGDVLGLLERAPQGLRRAAVVEVVGNQGVLGLIPVDIR